VASSLPFPAPRRRVSRRRYLARRVGVLVVLGLGLFGLFKVGGALVGGDSEPVAEGGSAPTEATASGSTTAPTTAVTTSTTSTTTTSTTTTTTEVPGPPSAENPARVLVVGDSDAGTFGPYLSELLNGTGIIETTVDYKVSSGLARPDFFDWPAHLRAQLLEVDPDIVVVTFGGNDAQGLAELDGNFPSEWNDPVGNPDEWTAEYSRRVAEVLDLLATEGRTVIWVGIPNDDNPDVTQRLAVQDQAVRAAVSGRAGVTFVDTWARFSGRDGNWAEYVVDPRDQLGKDVRADDGFHLNENGAEILAVDIASVVRADLVARGASI
jgi:uncharacterized protein